MLSEGLIPAGCIITAKDVGMRILSAKIIVILTGTFIMVLGFSEHFLNLVLSVLHKLSG